MCGASVSGSSAFEISGGAVFSAVFLAAASICDAEGAKYPWGDRAPTPKDARFNGVEGPAEVCKAPKNDFGLCDMAGNVWEWCADWYEKDYYAGAPDRNPHGPETGMYRVLRGGSWADVAKYLTCANRSWARPGERSPNIGLRCVKTLK